MSAISYFIYVLHLYSSISPFLPSFMLNGYFLLHHFYSPAVTFYFLSSLPGDYN